MEMPVQKTVLVVEDNRLNRAILSRILSTEYRVLEAENGLEGLELLGAEKDQIAGIILDIVMPVMDGYTFLEHMQREPEYKDIPVLVSTGIGDAETEKKTLKLGAWDFVSKPYDADILRFRLKNAIARSQMTAFQQLKYLAEYDTLTGIYNKQKFFAVTAEMLKANPDRQYVFCRFDIDRFQLINSFFGVAEGDRLLKWLGSFLRTYAETRKEGTFGRMEADVFTCCFPYEDESIITDVVDALKEGLKSYTLNFKLVPAVGIYFICDHSEPVNSMLDKASLAAREIKGNYIKNVSVYSENLSRSLEREQRIINEMSDALAGQQFQVYLQPKYNLSTNQPEGAEALVRWIHPERGAVSPGEFIPVFERNGFISQLDYYVWEQTCIQLKRWIDEGRKPYPVSVNVSRVDIYVPHLVESICALTKKYGIPNSLLQLELTESAYTDNPVIMKNLMKKMQAEGFTILMDDFGSGYSSLNILKDIEVNILKIDMKFLSDTDLAGRGENILASVIRMAKWLHIPVVAEGVEKLEQVDFLRGIGCEYVQGYYFARPMPIASYETLMESRDVFRPADRDSFDADAIWGADSQMEMLFANVLQAVGIYEFAEDRLEVIRVNQAFYDLFGYGIMSAHRTDPLVAVEKEYRPGVIDAFRRAVMTREPVTCEYQRDDESGTRMWVQLKLKYISKVGSKHIVFGSFLDLTAQRELDLELKKYRMVADSALKASGKILIVDDMETNRVILKEIFRKQYEIVEAENGHQALELLRELNGQVDIILLDLLMPEMDGTKFLEIRKQDPVLAEIPVIIITVDETAQKQIDTLSLGANDYIVKPFVEKIVLRRVQNALETSRRYRTVLKEYHTMVKQTRMDPLTGIHSWDMMKELVTHILLNRSSKNHALVLLDVDGIGKMNSRGSRLLGDAVLKRVAEKLSSYFRKEDIIGRYGDDEFCVLMTEVPGTELVEKKCLQFCAELNEELSGELNYPVTLCVGAAVSSRESREFIRLYEQANSSLNESRRQGENFVTVTGRRPVHAEQTEVLQQA